MVESFCKHLQHSYYPARYTGTPAQLRLLKLGARSSPST